MTHKKPAPSKPVTSAKLWDEMFTHANRNEWPTWLFDYISVHADTIWREGDKQTYSLLAPACYLAKHNGQRPAWEGCKHLTKREALQEAARLARTNDLYVVDCTAPRYL